MFLDSNAMQAYRAAVRSCDDGSWTQPTASPVTSRKGKQRRNDVCPCGSGKKVKKCLCARRQGIGQVDEEVKQGMLE